MTRRLGKYEIIEEIGSGGFATVYRAHDPTLDRDVAVKVLDPTLSRDPSLVERFRREARAAAGLRHPNIVRIHDISDAEGILAIVMELLPGPSLADILEGDAPLKVERAVELLRPLAEALDYAHGRGLIHRDVKPSNAIVDEAGHPVLTDFGLVKAAEESGSAAVSLTLAQTGMTLGTPAYMAPEQADPKADVPVDYRADLYSLGTIAYEALTGRVPFQGPTPLAVAMGHLLEPPPEPQELNPALPEGVARALLKGVAKDPDERFPSAVALVGALAADSVAVRAAGAIAVSGAGPVPAQPEMDSMRAVGPAGTVPPAKTASASLSAAAERPKRSARPPVWVWALAAVVALAVVAGLAFGLGRLGQSTKPEREATLSTASEAMLQPSDTPEPTATATPQPSATPRSSETPEPTAIPSPSATPQPNDTPTPTATDLPSPTATPQPSDTPVPTATDLPSPTARTLLKTTPMPKAGDIFVRERDGMQMVYIPAGEFHMGSRDHPEALNDENPQHIVYLDAFWLDRTEVSNAQYRGCAEAAACRAPTTCDWGTPTYDDPSMADHPVVCVSWDDAWAYCHWAGAQLPTEAEWEKAARGTIERTYPWGNSEPDCDKANYSGCVGGTSRVESHPAGASPYGALNLAGNVWEWVRDWYDSGYYGTSPPRNPQGPGSGQYHVLRGGSWRYEPQDLRSAYRGGFEPVLWYYYTGGFRCSLSSTSSP